LVVFGHARRQSTVVSLHSVAIPAEVNASDAAAVGAFLKPAIEKLGLAGASAWMCVGRGQAILKSLGLPVGADSSELASMVQFQVAKELPFSADEAVSDFIVGSHWDGGADAPAAGEAVLAAAVRLPVIDAARQLCDQAGLRLARLGLRPWANLRAVYRVLNLSAGQRVLLVDITNDQIEIDVMCDRGLEFSRSATRPAGGPEGDDKDAAVSRIVTEVVRSLQSVSAMGQAAALSVSMVSGATGLEVGVAMALAERLKVACELFDPAAGFAVARSPEVTAFGAVLGLTAHEQDEPFALDFLNPKRPVAPRDTRRIMVFAAGAAAAVLLLGTLLGRAAYVGAHTDVVAQLQNQNNELVKRNKDLKVYDKRLADITNWRGDNVDWLDQLACLTNLLPPPEEVCLSKLDCVGNQVHMEGRVRDPRVLSGDFAQAMAQAGFEVKNINQKNPVVNDPSGYQQQFSLDVLIPAKAKPVLATSRPVTSASVTPAAPIRVAAAERPASSDRPTTTTTPVASVPSAVALAPAATTRPVPAAGNNGLWNAGAKVAPGMSPWGAGRTGVPGGASAPGTGASAPDAGKGAPGADPRAGAGGRSGNSGRGRGNGG
jgi:Tfp pilus assembly PilM family ATPase